MDYNVCCSCGKANNCSIINGDCWCYNYPYLLPMATETTSCYCETCFKQYAEKKSDTIAAAFTPENAINNNWIKNLPKTTELVLNIDYYVQDGLYVFTKWYHLKRGYCCKNNCKHCAYGYTKEKAL